MSLIRWSPMMDPFGDFEEAFNRLPATMGGAQSFVPAMDVYETDKAVMVETPLAGVKPEDVEISVSNGILTVKGENKKEHEVDDKNYYRKEVRSGSFHREVMLPSAIEEEKVTAEFENGILKISCPKAAAPKAKKINVKIVKHKK